MRSLQLAFQTSVIKRSLCFSLVVGTILTAINQGDIVMSGKLEARHWFKIGLTYCVPFIVSTLSSVGALRQNESTSTKTSS
ncbi:MAG: nitrate/nitrite transporter NrtS [Pirellulaceae bacterium]|nr:nitrate/nitrite transporter NrtS [Pirellulaceae bacterium]